MRFPEPQNILDADAANELLHFFDRFPVLKVTGFSLWTFEEMTPDAAQVIADSGLDILFLDSVKVVSPEVVVCARCRHFLGRQLFLFNGLRQQPPIHVVFVVIHVQSGSSSFTDCLADLYHGNLPEVDANGASILDLSE
jgi:hypothetical protein